MNTKIYRWNRFWCPPDGLIDLGDEGFMVDPESKDARYRQSNVVSFEQIEATQCLIILGEQGIGKSYEIRRLAEEAKTKGQNVLYLDLATCPDASTINRDIFETSQVQKMVEGDEDLVLLLDSLDECVVDGAAHFLIRKLSEMSLLKVKLRLGCRTAFWNSKLSDEIARIFGNQQSVREYELSPLRRKDVRIAAATRGVDADHFIDEIIQKDVVPLAITPVTLDMLLDIFRRGESLPHNRAELFEKACRRHCTIPEKRRSVGKPGTLNLEERLAVAERIAALTVLCGRNAIWKGTFQDEANNSDLLISEICTGKESVSGNDLHLDEAAIREVLDTGLFSARGLDRMGWSHSSYLDFLAARYLCRSLNMKQVKDVLLHPDGSLVRQLAGVTGWISALQTEIGEWVLKNEPEILLRSDLALHTGEFRCRLVSSLLDEFETKRIRLYSDDIERRDYRKLLHDDLADQLRVRLVDGSATVESRVTCIHIAKECKLTDLQNVITELALDQNEDYLVRTIAAKAVARVGDKKGRHCLRPLAEGNAGDDPDDELKGAGLVALWPDLISASELTRLLTPPKREHFLGEYGLFIYGLADELGVNDLVYALRWACNQPEDHRHTHFTHLIDKLMQRSWMNLSTPSILDAFADVAAKRLVNNLDVMSSDYEDAWKSKLKKDVTTRRLVVEKLITKLSNTEHVSFLLHGMYANRESWVSRDDFEWLCGLLDSARPEEEKDLVAELIYNCLDWNSANQISHVLELCKRHKCVETEFHNDITPVELTSNVAKELRERRERWKELEQDRKSRKESRQVNVPPLAEIVERSESGDYEQWINLWYYMGYTDESSNLSHQLEYDVDKLPGWISADEELRCRIIAAAEEYISHSDPKSMEWLGSNERPVRIEFGYTAFCLLLTHDPDKLNSLDPEIWKTWAPVVVACPMILREVKYDDYRQIVEHATRYEADLVAETILKLFDAEFTRPTAIVPHERIDACWSPNLRQGLLERARASDSLPKKIGAALSALLRHKDDEAHELADDLLRLPLQDGDNHLEKALEAAMALVSETEGAGWAVVWPAMKGNGEFGTALTGRIAEGSPVYVPLADVIDEEKIADLYIWLVKHFPHAEDRVKEGVHTVSTRDSIGSWRDNLVRNLTSRGSEQSAVAVERIKTALPHLDWLAYQAVEARKVTRTLSWQPATPDQILALVSNSSSRFVQNGQQLLDVLIESLGRLTRELHGEVPSVRDLWDKLKDGSYKPVDEEDFSDYLKRFLDRDISKQGIIVNREVQIMRRRGDTKGSRTDIHINALGQHRESEPVDIITAIAEVKGCWDSKVATAMESQLLDRYMKATGCNFGLYVVGWFDCEAWKYPTSKSKRNCTGCTTIEEAKQSFEKQSGGLTTPPYILKPYTLDTRLN